MAMTAVTFIDSSTVSADKKHTATAYCFAVMIHHGSLVAAAALARAFADVAAVRVLVPAVSALVAIALLAIVAVIALMVVAT